MLSKRSVIQEFAFLVAVAAFLFLSLTVWRISTLQDAQIRQHLERQTAVIEKELSATFHHTGAMLKYMASQVGQHNAEKATDYYLSLFNAFTTDSTVKKSLAWSAVAWVRSDRKLTVDSAMGVLQDPMDMSSRAYIALSEREPGVLHIGEPIMGAISKRQVIPAAIGVVNAKGRYMGSLIVGFDVQHITSVLEKANDNAEGEYAVLDEGNQPLIQSREIVSEGKGFSPQKPYVLRHMENFPFSVYVTLPDSFTAVTFVSVLYHHIIEFLTGAAILAALLFYLHRRIVKPIGKLARAAESIAGGNTDVAIPRNGTREIEALADSIEDVRSAVSNAYRARSRSEEENRILEKIMVAKKRQARNLVHDLRAHASIVITFSEIISNNQYDRLIDQQYADYANDITRSGHQILDMVNEILDLEKSRSGKLELKPGRVEVAHLVEQTMRCFERKAQTRGIGLSMEIAANMPELFVDLKRTRRMVQNLLSNSLKFTKKGGFIKVTYILDEDDRPVIRVTDTGKGMTPEEIIIAMAEYGQVHHDNVDDHDSTGIGLPFVKQMMEEHGGHLEIDSEPGKGTTVSMIFDAQAVRHQRPKLVLVNSD